MSKPILPSKPFRWNIRRQWQWLLSAVFAIAQLSFGLEWTGGSLTRLTAFSADRPFQFRVLVPAVVHVIEGIVPLPLRLIYGIMTMISVFLLLYYFEELLLRFADRRAVLGWYLLIIVPLSANFLLLSRYYYPSDLLGVALFEAGLVFAIDRRWGWVLLITLLGALNRDTIALLVPAIIFFHWGTIRYSRVANDRKQLAGILFLQLVILGGVRGLLEWGFRQNSGQNVEIHLLDNIAFLRGVISGNPRLVLKIIGNFAGLPILTAIYFSRLPSSCRRILLLVPLTYAGMFVVGMYVENRIFGELIPLLSVSGVIILDSLSSSERRRGHPVLIPPDSQSINTIPLLMETSRP